MNGVPLIVEQAIQEAEENLTAELRKLTGRDDICAKFDRESILGWPEPKGAVGRLPEDYWESAE